MNCTTCRDALSDWIDDRLAPAEREAVRAHLRGCADCAGELDDIERALARLRAAPLEAPPAGLAARIVAAGAAGAAGPMPPLAAATPGAAAATDDASAGTGRRRLLAAAGLLLALSLGYAARGWLDGGREGRDGDEGRGDPGAARADLVAALDAARGDARGLERRLDDLDREARQRQEALAAELRAVREESAAARRELARASERLETQARESESLRERLASGQEERRRLEEALAASLAAAESERERARAAAQKAIAAAERAVVPAGLEPARGAPGPARVVFRRRGGRLEVVASGSLDELVPELLRLSRRVEDPEQSGAALTHLESLLAMRIPELRAGEREPAEKPADEPGLFERLAGNMTFLDRATEPSPPADAAALALRAHFRRLERAESAWRAYHPSTRESR